MTDADEIVAARVAAAVLACPSVVSLTSGPNGTCATYGPGVRVEGVCMRANAVEVHVVSLWDTSAAEVATEIREVLAPHLPGYVVDVVIEDISDMPVGAADNGVSDLGVSDIGVAS